MTQEEKQLLLKDLAARLPYGVKIAYKEDKNDYHCWTLRTLNAPGISKSDTAPDSDGEIEYIEQAGIGKRTSVRPLHLEKMLPYLRPLSSMTKEEKHELLDFGGVCYDGNDNVVDVGCMGFNLHAEVEDWLKSHHFDHRGLIEKGLALKAPEGMYKTE